MRALSKFYDSPIKFGLLVFGLIFGLGSVAGIVLGILIIGTANCQPGDICDGPAMAAGAIWSVSFCGSFFLGGIIGLFSFVVLRRKTKSLPRVTPDI